MALSNEWDENLRGRSIVSKEEAMATWKHWLNWGENDKIGGQIIRDIGKIADGDADLITFLEERTSSGIYTVANEAVYALSNLAHRGDVLAIAAIKRHNERKRLKDEADQQRIAQYKRENDQRQADQLGLTLETLYAQREEQRLTKLAQEQERNRRLALPSDLRPGQRVKCVIRNWPYAGAIGTVERAVTKYFVTVQFDDGYRTIQTDESFELLD
jgi:hypothetical protein